MSKYFSIRYKNLHPYTPGEQPQDQQYIKLNTNESPFPPAPAVLDAAAEAAENLQLYSDPRSLELRRAIAKEHGLSALNVAVGNGSDELLNFAFIAFGNKKAAFTYPSVTYGFYSVCLNVNTVARRSIPLKEDFTIDPEEYLDLGTNIVLANPNAPTGLLLSVEQIEQIVAANPDHAVIVDEAYIAFGGETCIPLVKKYPNLLVLRTFSKSHSLAGARLGYAIGQKDLIADVNKVKNCINPYNINRMTAACGIAALEAEDYYQQNIQTIMDNRNFTALALRRRGFEVLPSAANFLLVKPDFCTGEALYEGLKDRGILVRHWKTSRIAGWCRITIGTIEQMTKLIGAIDQMMAEKTEG